MIEIKGKITDSMIAGTRDLPLMGAFILLFLCFCPHGFAGEPGPGLTGIEVTCVDSNAINYATFQSHNQKVVGNQHGIFMTHIRSRNAAYTAQCWRLLHSTDGGKSFSIIHEATHATNPPVIETDEDGNIYLIRCEYEKDWDAYFYRFLAENDFEDPVISTIPKGSFGKVAAFYDRIRKQIYYFPHNGRFFVLKTDGSIKLQSQLIKNSEEIFLQYPHLSLDTDSTLYAAWTTEKILNKEGKYVYWDIHFMRSPDGGMSWENIDGTQLSLPVLCGHTGPTERITLDDQFDVHTWLSSFMARKGKVHLRYVEQAGSFPVHYVRYDSSKAVEDLRFAPEFKGQDLAVKGASGVFAASASGPESPLYYVSIQRLSNEYRPICIASDDNGETWYDYAVGKSFSNIYSLGGFREITPDGYILGSFTNPNLDPPHVYFFRIRAGISRAEVRQLQERDGGVQISFTNARGFPREIRFKKAEGPWGTWRPFTESVVLTHRPTEYQLRSSLNVVSPGYSLN